MHKHEYVYIKITTTPTRLVRRPKNKKTKKNPPCPNAVIHTSAPFYSSDEVDSDEIGGAKVDCYVQYSTIYV